LNRNIHCLCRPDTGGGSANNASTTITGRKYQEERADFLGIKAHLKLNKRQKGRVDPTTLRLALCAIIGAVWLDSGQDFTITTQVVQRLL
jgi:dsRNA-specific ribonuclease